MIKFYFSRLLDLVDRVFWPLCPDLLDYWMVYIPERWCDQADMPEVRA